MSSEEKSDAPETEKVEDTAKTEETPAAAEQTPAAAEETPAAAEETPAAAEETPAAAEQTPAAAEQTPAAAEQTPAAAVETPAAAVETPAAAEEDTIRSTTYSPPVGGVKIDTDDQEENLLTEKVVAINRCAKVVKGGRRFSFSALVVAGDQSGNVGYGFGKANEVAECIRKASDSAKTALLPVKMRGTTIPHETIGEFGGGKVMLRPASPGTGIIAGSSVRAVVEAAGIKDILTKSLGSNNHYNVVKATLAGLRSLRDREQIYKLRGKKVAEKKAL